MTIEEILVAAESLSVDEYAALLFYLHERYRVLLRDHHAEMYKALVIENADLRHDLDAFENVAGAHFG